MIGFKIKAIKAFFSKSNIPIYAIIVMVLLFGYYKIQTLQANNETLQSRIENVVEKNNRIATEFIGFKNQVARDLAIQQDTYRRIQQANDRNNARIVELYTIFNQSSDGVTTDIERISRNDPALVQEKINEATKQVFRDVEKNSNFTSDN